MEHDLKFDDTLLCRGPTRNLDRSSQWTPLVWAASWGHESVVLQLIDLKADLNVQDARGFTALSQAVYYRNTVIAARLIEAGALLDQTDNDAWTLLHVFSLIFGHVNTYTKGDMTFGYVTDYCQELLQATALHIAAYSGARRCVELLVSEGANVKAMNRHCQQPIHIAATFGHAHLVNVLISAGVSVDIQDGVLRETPLMKAIRKGNLEVAQVLIANGADIRAPINWHGETAFELARRCRYLIAGETIYRLVSDCRHGEPYNDADLGGWEEWERNGHPSPRNIGLALGSPTTPDYRTNSQMLPVTPLGLGKGSGEPPQAHDYPYDETGTNRWTPTPGKLRVDELSQPQVTTSFTDHLESSTIRQFLESRHKMLPPLPSEERGCIRLRPVRQTSDSEFFYPSSPRYSNYSISSVSSQCVRSTRENSPSEADLEVRRQGEVIGL